MSKSKNYKKATVWKITIKKSPSSKDHEILSFNVMTSGSSLKDMEDFHDLLETAAAAFGIDYEFDILNVKRIFEVIGSVGSLEEINDVIALREDGTVIVNDVRKLQMMAGIDDNLAVGKYVESVISSMKKEQSPLNKLAIEAGLEQLQSYEASKAKSPPSA